MIQPLRGTKDILPNEISVWQHIYNVTKKVLHISNYEEIRTPILENTNLFERVIGHETDIVNKEMYTFKDKSERTITLRPEGTASVARAFINNKLYLQSNLNRLWYLGPMFRYERPQQGRQRQFHQLGIECIGSANYTADVEVIRLATKILESLQITKYKLEINSIGNKEERQQYTDKLKDYLIQYQTDLDQESKKRLNSNPLRILDSKSTKIQELLSYAPKLKTYLNKISLSHFYNICENLTYLNIPYEINERLVRGLDYYNYTAFEIKTNNLNNENTICGGGRYDKLIEELGGPKTPSVGWAMGIERLIVLINNTINLQNKKPEIYIITQGSEARKKVWDIINTCEQNSIKFLLDLNDNTLGKQIRKASQIGSKICLILGTEEIKKNSCTIKWLINGHQEIIHFDQFNKYIKNNKNFIIN